MAKFVTWLNCNIIVMYDLHIGRTVRTVCSASHVSDHPSFSTHLISKESHPSCVCSDWFIFGSWVWNSTKIENKKPYTSLACIITINNASQRSKKMNHTLLMLLPLQVYFIGVCDHWLYSMTYVVWQKSNETDFLLTMNFILFTSQGYPLQNSSLGQLHSDGGVVSIVRSSAGRLLEYLSASWLRSSGYYPEYQNGTLSSGFWARGIRRSHRDWDPANRGGWGTTGMLFSAKNSLMETTVWHGALSWCSIQVRAMPGHTCATLFLSLSRTSQ